MKFSFHSLAGPPSMMWLTSWSFCRCLSVLQWSWKLALRLVLYEQSLQMNVPPICMDTSFSLSLVLSMERWSESAWRESVLNTLQTAQLYRNWGFGSGCSDSIGSPWFSVGRKGKPGMGGMPGKPGGGPPPPIICMRIAWLKAISAMAASFMGLSGKPGSLPIGDMLSSCWRLGWPGFDPGAGMFGRLGKLGGKAGPSPLPRFICWRLTILFMCFSLVMCILRLRAMLVS